MTAVDRAEKLETLRSIRSDHVLDYAIEDFTASSGRYDLILDIVGNRSVIAIKRVLKSGGTYVMVGGTLQCILQVLLAEPLTAWVEKKKLELLLHKPNHIDQLVWKSLVEAGEVMPVIDRRYSLSDEAQAIEYFGEGGAIGKVIVFM